MRKLLFFFLFFLFGFTAESHRANFIQTTYFEGNQDPTYSDSEEVNYQLSYKYRLFGDAYIAYTQQAYWQIYNIEESQAFREINHNPELFYSAKGFSLGYEHSSNGENGERSRSWDRAFFSYGQRLNKWLSIDSRVEDRIRFNSLEENPEIESFYGNYSLGVVLDYKALKASFWARESSFKAMFEYDLFGEKSSFNFMLSYFNGYGESLLNYDKNIKRVGVGLSIK